MCHDLVFSMAKMCVFSCLFGVHTGLFFCHSHGFGKLIDRVWSYGNCLYLFIDCILA